MRIRSQGDFWCGLIFVAIGLAFLIAAQNYRMGSAARMGPGYFPTLLGGLLALLGLSLTVPALLRSGEPFPRLHLRPMLALLAAILAFALLLEPAGFVIALIVLVLISAVADPQLRRIEAAMMALLLTLFSVLIFHTLLGLPLRLWPDL
jgi:hypothetical protein